MAQATLGTMTRSGIAVIASSWREFRRWPVLPAIVLISMGTLAAFAPWIAPQSPYDQNLRARNAPLKWASGTWYDDYPKVEGRYFLGADYVGRDVLSRVIHGASMDCSHHNASICKGTIASFVTSPIAGLQQINLLAGRCSTFHRFVQSGLCQASYATALTISFTTLFTTGGLPPPQRTPQSSSALLWGRGAPPTMECRHSDDWSVHG